MMIINKIMSESMGIFSSVMFVTNNCTTKAFEVGSKLKILATYD